jgi:hypothetical protein
MSASTFEFNISLPQEPRYLAMLRDVVTSAAQQAGCTETAAVSFARKVEVAAQDAPLGTDDKLAIVVSHADGLMEVRLGAGAAPLVLSLQP